MSDFTVHQMPVPSVRRIIPYVVCVQSDVFASLPSRLVVPLYASAPARVIQELAPSVSFEGQDLLFMSYEMTSFQTGELSASLGDLEHDRYRLLQAIDLLITGV
ncbi:hypothetical protein FF098_003245 [Parvularcula flava]|uniref:Toxin CcdB n=1 Tax=Aquisalinus luteolus TaxID=1566827 RepID=A0A8J3A1V1_9PROT|nr:CcdB family protein [Aquisalinus luteolus]NHK26923.1 hypothetical protein [Aquisalinus luteolus]GGH93824.1 hypothetical protein GCM10011355_06570 [Aquisalinus luteolus]